MLVNLLIILSMFSGTQVTHGTSTSNIATPSITESKIDLFPELIIKPKKLNYITLPSSIIAVLLQMNMANPAITEAQGRTQPPAPTPIQRVFDPRFLDLDNTPPLVTITRVSRNNAEVKISAIYQDDLTVVESEIQQFGNLITVVAYDVVGNAGCESISIPFGVPGTLINLTARWRDELANGAVREETTYAVIQAPPDGPIKTYFRATFDPWYNGRLIKVIIFVGDKFRLITGYQIIDGRMLTFPNANGEVFLFDVFELGITGEILGKKSLKKSIVDISL